MMDPVYPLLICLQFMCYVIMCTAQTCLQDIEDIGHILSNISVLLTLDELEALASTLMLHVDLLCFSCENETQN
jgi:hypothetical protein